MVTQQILVLSFWVRIPAVQRRKERFSQKTSLFLLVGSKMTLSRAGCQTARAAALRDLRGVLTALRSLGQWFGPAARANPNRGSSGCLLRRRLRRTFVRLQAKTAILWEINFPRIAVSSCCREPCSLPAASTGIRQQPVFRLLSDNPRSTMPLCPPPCPPFADQLGRRGVCCVPAAKAISEKERADGGA